MKIYAESSAVVAWLLGQSGGVDAGGLLVRADNVIASQLTIAECNRVLVRLHAMGRLDTAQVSERLVLLDGKSARWSLQAIDPDILGRVRQPFPAEPIRTLDAIHLASALAARASIEIGRAHV